MQDSGNRAEKEESNISRGNIADFMTSLQEIYSPQQLLMLSKTFGKLTRLVTPSNTTPPKVSKLISVMEVLRLHFTVTKHINGYLRVIPSHISQDQ